MVVLPFANIGGDPDQEYFVDGVTESLTTDLSRISGSFVIGRNTAFTYKRKPIDLKQVGRELNVRYVLEGSVQRGGSRMRVNVQLIDAETGNHLLADRFDKPVADLFDMQDEIIARLASTLNVQLVAAEARRAERAPNPDSMDLYFQGVACANKGWTPEHMAQAHAFYERALALDPGNIDALVGAASVDLIVVGVIFVKDRATRLARAEKALTEALSSAPEHAAAHLQMGVVHTLSNRAAQGIAEFERALALDHNLATAHAYIGFTEYVDGRAEETEAHILEALRLSPRDALAHVWRGIVGLGKFELGSYEEAVVWLRPSIDTNRSFSISHFFLAAALALLGRIEEARAAAQACLALDPDFTISRLRAVPFSDNPLYLATRERAYEGMRLAGFPE
jgi:TolB-like protein